MAEKRAILKIAIDDSEFQAFKKEYSDFVSGAPKLNPGAAAGTAAAAEAVVSDSRAAAATPRAPSADFLGIPHAGLFPASKYLAGPALHQFVSSLEWAAAKLRNFALFGLASGVAVGAIGVSAFSRYRESLGLGVTPGALSSFSAYYSPLINGGDVLSKVAEARNDLSLRPYLSRMGIGQRELETESNDRIARDITERAAQMWRTGPQTTQFAEATGLLNFFSMEDLRRLGATSPQELQRMRRRSERAEGELNFSPEVAQQWNDFTVELRKAGVQIDTVLIKGLVRLSDPLKNLVQAVVTSLDSFLNNPGMADTINEVAKGIKWFAAEIQTPEFQNGIKSFVTGIVSAAEGVARFVEAVGGIFGGNPAAATNGTPGGGQSSDSSPNMFYAYQAWMHDLSPAYTHDTDQAEFQANEKIVRAAEANAHLPPGMLVSVWGAESNYSRNTRQSSAGAVGPFQMMPSVYKALNINPNDITMAAPGEANLLNQYLIKYKGDEAKALAANNMKHAELDEDIAKYRDQWMSHIPIETQNYINKVMSNQSQLATPLNRLPTNPKISLDIHSNTASNIAVTASQLSH